MSDITIQDRAGSPERPLGLHPAVAAANARARRRERVIALVVVLVPFAALLMAIVQMWRDGTGPMELGLLAGMYALTMTGVMVGFHRHFAHCSFQTTRWLRVLLGILGSMAGEGPILYWTAVHRRHHALSDRPGDPHSPHLSGTGLGGWLRGFWYSHIGWMFAHEVTDWARYNLDLLRDRTVLRIHRLYFVWLFLGLAIPTALGGLFAGTWTGAGLGLLWGGLVRICFCQHAAWSIGSIAHLFGTAPFQTHDESRNNFWIAIPTWGEGWHNNHHAFPYSAYHGLRWWQIDPSAYVIRLLELFGLAWDVKAPPEHLLRQTRAAERKDAEVAVPATSPGSTS